VPETWRRTGPDRLAPDAAVARPGEMLGDLAAGAGPAIAWTIVTSPALVLGRAAHDPPLDLDLAGREGIAILRRGSGGGAVLWDADLLALDVALPPDHALAARDVVEAYRWLGEALGEAMRDLGMPSVRVVPPDEARADRTRASRTVAACFGALSPHEVTAEGRKLVGLSQVRRRTGVLLQVGIPLTFDASLLARLLRFDADATTSLAARTVGAREYVPGIRDEDVIDAVDLRLRERAEAGRAAQPSRPA